jgi:peptidase C39-like protein
MDRRSLLQSALVVGTAGAGLAAFPGLASAAGQAVTVKPQKNSKGTGTRNISYARWTQSADFATGTGSGVTTSGDVIAFQSAAGQTSYTDPHLGTTASYDYATWTSPYAAVGFTATEAVSSWTADTPAGTFVKVELRGTTAGGATTGWYVMGIWSADDATVSRTSVNGQSDVNGSIATDTFVAATGGGLTAIQLRVTLLRATGSAGIPRVRSIGVMASALPSSATASSPGSALGVTLPVPGYSQQIHAGQYPQWAGGGEAWCSPTSTSMVVAFWGQGPTATDYAWVDPSYADPWVDYAARNTFDYAYGGTGNWPFNTAYAGRFGLDGFITRLRSLNEAELFIAAGIPLVLSLSFKKSQIPGLNYGTAGHLLVLVGFSASGDPVLNDPFSASDSVVRKTVGRAEFESAWLTSSGGTTYVITPAGYALPPAPAQANW